MDQEHLSCLFFCCGICLENQQVELVDGDLKSCRLHEYVFCLMQIAASNFAEIRRDPIKGFAFYAVRTKSASVAC